MSLYRLKGTAGAVINRKFDLDEPVRIGVNGGIPPVGELAAEISFADGRITLARHGDAEVQVNGETVDSAQLVGGDEIRVATCRFMVQAPGLRPDRVLTEDAVRPRRSPWPWVLAALLAAAAAAIAGWQLGWFVRGQATTPPAAAPAIEPATEPDKAPPATEPATDPPNDPATDSATDPSTNP
ncbi:hypothetical protein F3N42_13920 [Marinihelvus fidelis]|uniref:YscD cytoplasmic domain-containing protein n=1 Tax=Marinihelvus fidelis TaxID=2613842 RepID=A0A5N0T5Z8_9GAMM|nr:hypothetical protein [Marinihelvus fidelis]KAA9129874.1 hypothetical protein F3N42_13920 [Marinihelvus fidelis]